MLLCLGLDLGFGDGSTAQLMGCRGFGFRVRVKKFCFSPGVTTAQRAT